MLKAKMKACKGCNESFPADSYYLSGARKGRTGFCTKCYSARNEPKRIEREYGISYVQYLQLTQDQNGLCAICNKPEEYDAKKPRSKTKLSLDHSHSTGKVRSLLCNKCNLLISYAEENQETLQKAIQYLKRWDNV